MRSKIYYTGLCDLAVVWAVSWVEWSPKIPPSFTRPLLPFPCLTGLSYQAFLPDATSFSFGYIVQKGSIPVRSWIFDVKYTLQSPNLLYNLFGEPEREPDLPKLPYLRSYRSPRPFKHHELGWGTWLLSRSSVMVIEMFDIVVCVLESVCCYVQSSTPWKSLYYGPSPLVIYYIATVFWLLFIYVTTRYRVSHYWDIYQRSLDLEHDCYIYRNLVISHAWCTISFTSGTLLAWCPHPRSLNSRDPLEAYLKVETAAVIPT